MPWWSKAPATTTSAGPVPASDTAITVPSAETTVRSTCWSMESSWGGSTAASQAASGPSGMGRAGSVLSSMTAGTACVDTRNQGENTGSPAVIHQFVNQV
ncbi:hypothetical protein GCM10017714_27650 [Curtobacterium pusillum]|nr:hypothetical protein GCM10017610_31800 [Curtobacterium pusillum]